MQNYERLILSALEGETPRAKYDRLMKMYRLLRTIGWPRRGTHEMSMDISQAAEDVRDTVSQETAELGDA